MQDQSIPDGYCQCGCGGKTSIARQADRVAGYRPGSPRRWIKGHNGRGVSTPRYSDDELLARLRSAAERLGRTPQVREIGSYATFVYRFGSWHAAVAAAGLEPNEYGGPQRFSDQGLLSALRSKADTLGRTPTIPEINADPAMPAHTTYFRRFGTYREAVIAAGLDTAAMPAAANTFASPLDHHLQTKYGITEVEYWAMNEAQGGLCKICGEPETWVSSNSSTVTRLSVDHCHETGVVRGLLCNRCNKILGVAGDDYALLRSMADYLERLAIVVGTG